MIKSLAELELVTHANGEVKRKHDIIHVFRAHLIFPEKASVYVQCPI